jgi:hypothetical protein
MWHWRNRGEEQGNEGAPEVRTLLRGLDSNRAEPSPFFAKRVMAAIEAREAELGRRARAWAAIPSFAYRVSAIAALLLVMASTWLWSGIRSNSDVTVGFVEDSASNASQTNQDEVFVTPSEDAR